MSFSNVMHEFGKGFIVVKFGVMIGTAFIEQLKDGVKFSVPEHGSDDILTAYAEYIAES